MADLAHYADPQLLDDPRTSLLVLQSAEFSDDAETIDGLARSGVTSAVLRKIARNPATAEHTLEYLIDIDQRWLTYPATRRADLSADLIDRIARRLTDRNAVYHLASAPSASSATLRHLAQHPSAPAATREMVAERLGADTQGIENDRRMWQSCPNASTRGDAMRETVGCSRC